MLPELGVGIVYTPGLEPLLDIGRDLIDVVEVEPQVFWFRAPALNGPFYRLNTAAFARFVRLPQRKIIHGVGFPVAGSCALEIDQMEVFLESIERLQAVWASEHLSFNRGGGADGFYAGFLLPPRQTLEGAALAASNIRRLKTILPVPFAFETGTNYLRPASDELSDGAFIAAVSEMADCGILLDLHNLWCNERNGRQPLRHALAEIPLERVWEVHVAGGREMRGYWLDAHSGLVPEKLMAVAAEVIPKLPNLKAIIFEIIEEDIQEQDIRTSDLLKQTIRLRELWSMRGTAAEQRRQNCDRWIAQPDAKGVREIAEWEFALACLVNDWSTRDPSIDGMKDDPGIAIYRDSIKSVRGGMVVTALRLTTRLLRLSLGEETFEKLMMAFWSTVPPEPFTSDEAANFVAFLTQQELNVLYLDDVLRFEVARNRSYSELPQQPVSFHYDPILLLQSLGAGRLPEAVPEGNFELVIRV